VRVNEELVISRLRLGLAAQDLTERHEEELLGSVPFKA
jgi:hypothetical protein